MAEQFRLDRALIRVSGPDALDFLQGLLTQDLSRLDGSKLGYGALLNPQGKVILDMLIWPAGDGGVILEVDPANGADLMRRLTLYKLRARVQLEDVSSSRTLVWSASSFADAVTDPRLPDGGLGFRAIAPKARAAELADGASAYEARRISAGVPDLARDATPEEAFALEALLEELDGVDFNKGCFVGQENVSRMKRRATTRKKFCPVVFEGRHLPFGAPVVAGTAELGTVRSSGPGRALAFLRLDRAEEALKAGVPLMSNGLEVRLDPPHWLIRPAIG